MPLLIWMSLCPSWQPGDHVSCCSIWSDFGSGSGCLSHPPPQISVDPNVWVLKSATCFLVRCQGDTVQEQRTGERQSGPTCWGERLFLHWSPPPQAFLKADAGERNIIQNSDHLYVAGKENRVKLECRRDVFPFLTNKRVFAGSILFYSTAASETFTGVQNHLIAMCSSAWR